MKYISQVIDVRMIDQQDMHTALQSWIGRSSDKSSSIKSYRSPWRNQYAHASRIFKEQRAVTDTEFTCGRAEWRNRHGLRACRRGNGEAQHQDAETYKPSDFHWNT